MEIISSKTKGKRRLQAKGLSLTNDKKTSEGIKVSHSPVNQEKKSPTMFKPRSPPKSPEDKLKRSFTRSPEFKSTKEFKVDTINISLGKGDSKPQMQYVGEMAEPPKSPKRTKAQQNFARFNRKMSMFEKLAKDKRSSPRT